MDDDVLLHVVQALHSLVKNGHQLFLREHLRRKLAGLHELVEVEAQLLEDDDHVLPELEVVEDLNDSVFAFFEGGTLYLAEQLDFDVRVVYVELFILADLGSDDLLLGVLVIDALHYLAKCSLVDDAHHLVAVPQLFPNLSQVVSLLICQRVLTVPPDIANSVDLVEDADFNLFQLSQLACEDLECFLAGPAVEILRSLSLLRCTLAAGSLGLRRCSTLD